MATDYNYDEQGQFFPYFILTITGLVTIPVTYSLLRPSKELENTAPRINSDFIPEHADLIDGQRRKQKRRERKLKRMTFAVAGWLLMAYMVYLMAVTTRTTPKIWNPFEILDIPESASEKQIKSHYRKLSLTQHPDKVKLDPEQNVTMESVNEHWVELTKAFKTLTDEEVRNNWIQFGHPDGKQSFSIGIALPKFIVQQGNGKYVLVIYGALLGVLLPSLVGSWWYGTQRMTKEKVLVASAGNLFKDYESDMAEGSVVAALSSGEEYQQILKGNKAEEGSAKLEQKLLAEGEAAPSIPGMTVKDKSRLKDLDDAAQRKALGLLWAYMGRVELEDNTLNDEKYEVAPTALALNEAFTSIALAYGNIKPLLSSYHISQSLIQAVPPSASPLLQLPHFTPAIVQAIEGKNSRKHMSVQNFMSIPSEQRRKLSTGAGLTAQQYDSAMSVASQLPLLKVEKAFFKVVGERSITPSSLVQLVLKARIIPPGSRDVREVIQKDLEDIDPDEGDVKALPGREKRNEQPIQPPLAHAPYFARDRSPRWHVFLADSKPGKIAVPPFTFFAFDKPLFDEQGKPMHNVQTLKMQFQAPPQVGTYTFMMHLICDSYIGMDTMQEVVLNVEEMAKAEEIAEEEEISEPDEDSLAGQMNALKTGGVTGAAAAVAAAPRKKVKKPVVEESSEGSDTEGEEDTESETDTDTDTDEE